MANAGANETGIVGAIGLEGDPISLLGMYPRVVAASNEPFDLTFDGRGLQGLDLPCAFARTLLVIPLSGGE